MSAKYWETKVKQGGGKQRWTKKTTEIQTHKTEVSSDWTAGKTIITVIRIKINTMWTALSF